MGDVIRMSEYRARRLRKSRIRFALDRAPCAMQCVICTLDIWPRERCWQWISRAGLHEAACEACFEPALDRERNGGRP